MQHVFLRGALTKQALACLFFVHACNMYFARLKAKIIHNKMNIKMLRNFNFKIRQANGLEACPSTYDLLLIFNLDKMSERQATLIAKYHPLSTRRAPLAHPPRLPCGEGR